MTKSLKQTSHHLSHLCSVVLLIFLALEVFVGCSKAWFQPLQGIDIKANILLFLSNTSGYFRRDVPAISLYFGVYEAARRYFTPPGSKVEDLPASKVNYDKESISTL